ncbi:MAG: hypothetical protein ACXWQO_06325 [Bdellovibrionota bacterium]
MAAAFAFSSCAGQIKEKIQTISLISPETAGEEHHIEAGAGVEGTTATELSSDAAVYEPTPSSHRIVNEVRFSLRGNMQLLKRFDLLVESAPWVGFKFQALGDSHANAQKGNFSVAVVGLAGAIDHTGRGSGVTLSSKTAISVSPDVHYTIASAYWKAGLLSGYRVNPSVLFYGGYYYQLHRYHGTYERKNSFSGSFAGVTDARSFNLGFELLLSQNFIARMEEAYSITRIPSSGARSSQFSYGLMLAGLFDFLDHH